MIIFYVRNKSLGSTQNANAYAGCGRPTLNCIGVFGLSWSVQPPSWSQSVLKWSMKWTARVHWQVSCLSLVLADRLLSQLCTSLWLHIRVTGFFRMLSLCGLSFVLCSLDLDVLRAQRIIGFFTWITHKSHGWVRSPSKSSILCLYERTYFPYSWQYIINCILRKNNCLVLSA